MTDKPKKGPIQQFIDESRPLEEPFYSTLSNNLLDLIMTDETKKGPIQQFIDESWPLEEPFYRTLSNNVIELLPLDLIMTDEPLTMEQAQIEFDNAEDMPIEPEVIASIVRKVMKDEPINPKRFTEEEIDRYCEILSAYNPTHRLYKESGEVIEQLRADLKAAQENANIWKQFFKKMRTERDLIRSDLKALQKSNKILQAERDAIFAVLGGTASDFFV